MFKKNSFDKVLLALTVFLVLFGLLVIYDASVAKAENEFQDKYFFLKEQAKWVVVGFVALLAGLFFDYRKYFNLSLPIFVFTLALLILVFFPVIGVKALGAHRWINFGVFVVQPAEIAKLSVVITLSAAFYYFEKTPFLSFISFLFVVGAVFFLVLAEPDMGTAIIIALIGFGMFAATRASIFYSLSLVPLMIAGGLAVIISSPYRLKRLNTFFSRESDPLGASYHVNQALIALGSGGLLGLGLGNSRQKYQFLPEVMTDSIFAVLGEELGLVGTFLLVLLLLLIFLRGVKIALNVKDSFGKSLALGISLWLAVQAIVNIGAMVALIPLTGVPLPFISYGGSALVAELLGIGVLLNISKQVQYEKNR